jgi:solute carrier family 25 protein 44
MQRRPELQRAQEMGIRLPGDRLAELVAGAGAGATIGIGLQPLDTIRTRAQTSGQPALKVLKELMATEGVPGLWKGTAARLAILVPQGAIQILLYEFVKRFCAVEVG